MANQQIYDPHQLETLTVCAEWWPDSVTVTVKERSFEDNKKMEQSYIGTVKMPTSKAAAKRMQEDMEQKEMDMENMAISEMLFSLVSWGFTNGKGVPLEVNHANVQKLRGKDADFIMKAIKELNPDSDDEDFPGDSGISSKDR